METLFVKLQPIRKYQCLKRWTQKLYFSCMIVCHSVSRKNAPFHGFPELKAQQDKNILCGFLISIEITETQGWKENAKKKKKNISKSQYNLNKNNVWVQL